MKRSKKLSIGEQKFFSLQLLVAQNKTNIAIIALNEIAQGYRIHKNDWAGKIAKNALKDIL